MAAGTLETLSNMALAVLILCMLTWPGWRTMLFTYTRSVRTAWLRAWASGPAPDRLRALRGFTIASTASSMSGMAGWRPLLLLLDDTSGSALAAAEHKSCGLWAAGAGVISRLDSASEGLAAGSS